MFFNPLLMAPSSNRNTQTSASFIIPLFLIITFFPPSYKVSCDYFGLIWTIQEKSPHLKIVSLYLQNSFCPIRKHSNNCGGVGVGIRIYIIEK